MLPPARRARDHRDRSLASFTPNEEASVVSKIQKLELNRETLRRLTEEEARQVQGAAVTKLCPCTHTSAGPSHPIWC